MAAVTRPIIGPCSRGVIGLLVFCLSAAACAADDQVGTRLVDEVLLEGLAGPTQLSIGPAGDWWVGLIGGPEDDGRGQVIRIDPENLNRAPTVVLAGLDKPTGVAVFAGELWVMERDRLTRGPLDGSTRTVVADDLPNNGRSEGTLTVDGQWLLYNTSGKLLADGTPVEDSGTLWSVDESGITLKQATGFKHAYAHVRLADGTLLTTEVGDGRYDGNRPDDEVVGVVEGTDHGWPRCVGDNVVVVEYGGTAEICELMPNSHVVFPPGATPTSILVAPWDPDQVLVALWNEGQVVSVPVDGARSQDVSGGYDVVYSGSANPQHLTVYNDQVLLTDHIAGRIIVLSPGG